LEGREEDEEKEICPGLVGFVSSDYSVAIDDKFG
jgi:hypothetical protein